MKGHKKFTPASALRSILKSALLLTLTAALTMTNSCTEKNNEIEKGESEMPNEEITIYKEGEADYLTQTWTAAEIPFTAAKRYGADECLCEIKFDVTFTAPDGTKMTMPGFWDGGKDWKVRFAPTMPGMWSYTTSCGDEGLNGLGGTLAVNPYDGELEIYRHGFVKTEPGKKYMTYADGTPFFYLGDTHWNMYAEEFSSAGDNAADVKTDSHFKAIVDERVRQGFTVYQSEPIDSPFDLTDGFSESDVDGFAKADRYYQYIAQAGLVHANAEFFFSSAMSYAIFKKPENMNDPAIYRYLEGLSRYWVARFGAYPVIYTLAQECDNDFYYERGDQKVFTAENNPWCKVCEYLHKYDPYSSPISAHMENTIFTTATGIRETGASAFTSTPGHSWWAVQWSPNIASGQDFAVSKDFWNTEKATVNYEGRYDGLWTGHFGERAQGWISFLSGMYGYGYGCADIWLYKSTYNLDADSNDGVETITKEQKASYKWGNTLYFESALQMKHLKNFLEAHNWYDLEPMFENFDLFIPKIDAKSWYCGARTAKSSARDIIVIYFYNSSYNGTGRIVSLDADKTYTASFYDPRTGEYQTLDTSVSGSCTIPEKPDGDMVFVLEENI